MPRSSGGGSHSGGHRSSSGSSRSYSGGSHSSGYRSNSSTGGYSGGYSGNAGSAPKPRLLARVSDSRFRGARRYVYYEGSRPRYFYSDYTTASAQRRRLWFWGPFTILFAIVLIAVLQPAALTMDYDTDIYISDTLDLIEDTDSLFDAMEEFRNATGITPFVATVANESWVPYYADLSSAAFDIYVNQFEDEKHWLLVYSQPAEPDPAFNDWYWEGMQGDDTVYILTEDTADAFGMALQKYLTNNRYSVGEAFTMAFREITPVIMDGADVDASAALGACIVMALVIWIAIRRTGLFKRPSPRPENVPAQAVEVKRFTKEINCEYCGGVYLSDSFNCPHCGAGRQAIN